MLNASNSTFFKRENKVLKKFNSDQYYELVTKKSNTNVPDTGILLKGDGLLLINEYWNTKYNTNMTIPLTAKRKLKEAKDIIHLIDQARKKEKTPGNYREEFIIGEIYNHATPILYIKENGKEGLLISDSLGKESIDLYDDFIKIMIKTGLPVYVVAEGRQADGYSCYMDALVMGRETTSFDEDKQQYRLPHLLADLKADGRIKTDSSTAEGRLQIEHGLNEVLLPDPLLLTAQRKEKFIQIHKEETDKIVHKNETLTEFHARYSNDKGWLTFPKEKGYKLSDVIKIQYYINEFKKLLGREWTDKLQNEFMDGIKEIIKPIKNTEVTFDKNVDAIHNFAKDYLEKLKVNETNELSSDAQQTIYK